MAKFCVQIYGTVPEELEIEAENSSLAMDQAMEEVARRLTFVIHSSASDPGAVFVLKDEAES